MRILAAADVHGFVPVYEWLLDVARREADALVLAGDLLPSGPIPEQRDAAGDLVSRLRAAGLPVLYIMGNDDDVTLEVADEQIRPLHGARVVLDGYAFVGYQFSPPFVGDVFVKPEREIAADLAGLARLVDPETVLVTHSPARGAVDKAFGIKHAGSKAIAAFLQQHPVAAHIHGHIHEAFGRDGSHFNVASAGRRRAMLIDLPALTHTVVCE